jgi:hypothetical protein
MKNSINFLTLVCIILNFTTIQTHNDIGTYYQKKGNRYFKIKEFTPDKQFGGVQARGQYIRQLQTARITYGNSIYTFTNIKQGRNPVLKPKKNDPKNLILVGTFTTYNSGPEMPVTTYLYGVLKKKYKNPRFHIKTQQNQPDTQNEQDPVGTNPATYAPMTFEPSENFQGTDLIGNYFKATQVATIHDPSGQNKQIFRFNNVQQGGITTPEGLTLIGSYVPQKQCSGNVCSHARIRINLYGTLIENDENA